jgi:hypothetical protein
MLFERMLLSRKIRPNVIFRDKIIIRIANYTTTIYCSKTNVIRANEVCNYNKCTLKLETLLFEKNNQNQLSEEIIFAQIILQQIVLEQITLA